MSMTPQPETDAAVEQIASGAVSSRRSFVRTVALGAAALGAAAATGTALASAAGASESMTSSSGGASAAGSAEATLSAADTQLLLFLHGVSTAAQQALQAGADQSYLTSTYAERLREFSRHHRDQAARLAKLLPTDVAATSVANPSLLAQMNGRIGGAGSQTALLGVVAEYEETLSATFIDALAEAEHFTVAEAIAGCAPILGQQAASLGADAGEPQPQWLPAFAPTTGALTPAAFPIR
ncbi:MAG: hypothetical protein KGR18_10955 [Acidobacteria bacterium]|nr:hypothetical protein [Acidobacteriota bacterium]